MAARGVVGRAEDFAAFDQIVTEPTFGRRGLGPLVMGVLVEATANAGATDHLLIATEEGRALYSSLGWTDVSDIVSSLAWPGT